MLLPRLGWAAGTIEFDAHATPFRHTFSPPPAVGEGRELLIQGENRAKRPATLVIRLDDGRSRDYRSRVNAERVVVPGHFTLRLPLSGLRTPSGRPLDPADLRRLMLFVGDGDPPLTLGRVAVVEGPSWPAGSLAWDLGPAGGPLFPGFERITPAHSALSGEGLRAIRRAGGDALLADGIQGPRALRLHLPLPPGRWRLAVWTEDLGEWELLPHPLRRTLRADGVSLLEEDLSPGEWIERRYLAGRAGEAGGEGGPWELFGGRRGGLLRFEVEVGAGGLSLELVGDSPAATHLAALLAWPAAGEDALARLEEARRERFEEQWPVAAAVPREAVPSLILRPRHPGNPLPAAVPGSSLSLEFTALSPLDESRPTLIVEPPGLPTAVRFGHWRHERPNAAATLLSPGDDHLRGDLAGLTLAAGVPRRLHLRIAVPEGTPAGVYRGRLQLMGGGGFAVLPFALEVLPLSLPPAGRPLGPYLERPPHLGWFAGLAAASDEALECDLRLLRGEGITAIAPPFTTPDEAGADAFLDELARYRDAGFVGAPLAYAPLKRLVAAEGEEGAVARLARVMAEGALRGLTAPLWAVADEARPGELPAIARLADALHIAMPNGRVAGQLNQPAHAVLLPHLDVALLNTGFGVDEEDLRRVERSGAEPWFYNLGSERLAAGFYLWRVGAKGYLQWHGRMPTADPFDPTDGRESDIQLIFPTNSPCPAVPDVHARLFALAEGVVDLRWLRWLEGQAGEAPEAAALLAALRREVPARWAAAEALGEGQAERWRGRIVALARRMLTPDPGPAVAGTPR